MTRAGQGCPSIPGGAVAEDDEATVDRGVPADEPFPLLIAVTPSPAERIRLAERLDGIAPLLLVADLDELRRLIAAPQQVAAAPSEPAPVAALVIDSARSSARCGGREIDLTRLEHDLLTCLISEPVRVWSYAELHRSVWGDEGRERKADVQSLVKRLRRKLHALGTGAAIDVVRGVGLRLTDHQQARVERA
ncbi:DNA-binding winged helix-turn-helix (wHTH) protein [Micromonospora luteifusca]|uniref:DNA-binding winged helix-turn-helix (WHTH) protein n=1 Tax=Micromonospora luteifusca TaxID=709860 RepID=A0ABS2LLL9_9ACTN|nr:winged helix-turn-helix domain-containing protein [Micromonospora luteifusca]MBM7489078.1 DNA-binding winged helix-turn-helix (wHTH) protein [Micromonospora luteifusca]